MKQSVLTPLSELKQKALDLEKKCKTDRRQLEIYNSVLHNFGKLLPSESVETANKESNYQVSKIGLWASDLRKIMGIPLDQLLLAPPSTGIINGMFPCLTQQEIQSLRQYARTSKEKEDEFEKLAKDTKVDDIEFEDMSNNNDDEDDR